jgi:8-amino-7-oxononanoate synthase
MSAGLTSADPDWLDRLLQEQLDRRSAAGQLRRRRVLRVLDATRVELDGHRLVNFASNDYLGLAHHPRLKTAVEDAACAGAVGSGASALVTGYGDVHAAAEAALAAWKGTEAAVLLPSGYQAAHAAVQTLAAAGGSRRAGVRFLIDKLAHASLIDAVLGSKMPWRTFPHNAMARLGRLLGDAPAEQVQVVVSESIFSMDGDACDLAGLAELKGRFAFALLLDEAHGSGVYGPGGAGYAAERGRSGIVDVSLVTLSKATGLAGGALCGSKALVNAVANLGRAYVYSTSVTPVVAAAVPVAIRVMRDEPERQARLRLLAGRVRGGLAKVGLVLAPGDSPIIPIILGSEENALRAAEGLREDGTLVVAIRPPTVRRGSSRLRVTLSCEHSDEQVEHLVRCLTRRCAERR